MEEEKKTAVKDEDKKGFFRKWGLLIQGILVFGVLGGVMIYFMTKA